MVQKYPAKIYQILAFRTEIKVIVNIFSPQNPFKSREYELHDHSNNSFDLIKIYIFDLSKSIAQKFTFNKIIWFPNLKTHMASKLLFLTIFSVAALGIEIIGPDLTSLNCGVTPFTGLNSWVPQAANTL